MNTPNQKNAANDAATTVVHIKKAEPRGSEPTSTKTKPGAKSDPRETAQEGFHQVTPKDSIKAPFTPVTQKSSMITPLRAAKGDDDLMSQQQKPS